MDAENILLDSEECAKIATEEENITVWTSRVLNFPFPISSLFHPDAIKRALQFRFEPGDVMLSSYPRCDSKIVEVIVWKLTRPLTPLPPLDTVTRRYLPCIETAGVVGSPRIISTHLPLRFIPPIHTRVKYIYVVRTPWDACTAYYRLLLRIGQVHQSFDTFFNNFIAGNVGYGDYFEHVDAWQKYVENDNVLILSREHIKCNPRSALFTIAAFLGEQYLNLLQSDSLVHDILNSINYDGRKRKTKVGFGTILTDALPRQRKKTDRSYFNIPGSAEKPSLNKKEKCSDVQVKQLMEKASKTIKDTGIEHFWIRALKRNW